MASPFAPFRETIVIDYSYEAAYRDRFVTSPPVRASVDRNSHDNNDAQPAILDSMGHVDGVHAWWVRAEACVTGGVPHVLAPSLRLHHSVLSDECPGKDSSATKKESRDRHPLALFQFPTSAPPPSLSGCPSS